MFDYCLKNNIFLCDKPNYGFGVVGLGRAVLPFPGCSGISSAVASVSALSSVEQETVVRPSRAIRAKVRIDFFMVVNNLIDIF